MIRASLKTLVVLPKLLTDLNSALIYVIPPVFLYPLKALEKSDVSIVYRKGSVAWNWLKNLLLEIWIMVNLIVNLKSYVDNERVLMKKSSK